MQSAFGANGKCQTQEIQPRNPIWSRVTAGVLAPAFFKISVIIVPSTLKFPSGFVCFSSIIIIIICNTKVLRRVWDLPSKSV